MTEKTLYEIMFILNPDLGEQQTEKDIKEIKEFITSNGGKVTFDDVWGNKEFAYRIGKYDQGYYVVLNFEMDAQNLAEFNHQLNLNQHVIRHLVIRAPKNYKTITFEELKKEQEKETLETEAKRKEAREKKLKKVERPAKKVAKYVEKPKKVEEPEVPQEGETEVKMPKKKPAKSKISELEDVDEKLKNIINDPDISL
ncbi:30S ribosomal protein S6 [Candidatus Peregrinibacteria bacterium]|nr:30S ribosomal protein S6 [Candidatus Peregrinibacteria bacterium]